MSDPSRPRADEDERDQANASLDVGQQQVEQQQDPEVDASVDTRKQQWNINEQKREEYKQKVIDADARRAATPNADIWERVADAGGGRHAQEQAQLAKQDEALLKDAVPQLEQNKLNRVKEAERINAAQDRQAAQARTKELRIFEAQGGETTVDPTTGEKTEALHPDGSFRSKPGAIEGQKPFIEEYRTSTDAAASILGGGTDTGVLGATGGEQAEGKLVQPTRNDRFETANVPIEKKTDPKTGEIYSETKDEFGNPTRVTFGQDQKIPRLNQIGQEIDTRDMELQALDVQRMQIEPGFKATETAYEELKKKREAKQPFIQVDGKWIERPDEEVPKDPKDRAAWLKTQYKAQPEKLAVYQRSRAMEEPAWQKASKEYEAARPQWENLQSTTDALKLKKEKAILTKKRVELDLPEEDGGIAATLTAADAGLPEGGFKPVLDAIREHGTTYQMATGLTGSGQGIEMGTVNSAESPQPGEGIPTDAEIEGTVTGARNAGEAPPQVPGTAPSVPLIPQDDPAKLKAFTSSFKGLANPEQFTLGAKGANYQYIQKDGLNIASLDTNRKNGHAFLLLNEADRSRFDLKGLINTEAKDGLPVYLAEREQQPDPLTEAKWASEVFVTIADIVNGTFAEGPGSNEAQHAKLKEMGADLPSLQKKVNSGEISVQTGGALMKELYGVSLTPAEYDSPQALQKYIEETTKKELAEGVKPELTTAAKWKEANTAENFSLSGKESVKNDYAADYILQNRHSPLLTRADQKALYAKNADTADVSFVDQLNSKLTATKKFAANSLIAPVVGIVVGIGRDAAQAVFSGSETALFGDSKGYKDLEASLALRYGGASANVYGMERNREKWFTLEGIQLAGNLDTALNAYRDIVDANEDTATPNKAAEDAARKQVIELGLAMHNLARNDDDPISEKDIDPHQDKALAMALVRYKGTADPRAWELLKDRLLMSNDRRRVSAEMEAKTKGMGEFMAALTMGSYADPIEIGSEALSVFTMGGYGALAKGGKAVNVALKGNSLYKASRVGKIATTLTDGLRKEALAFKALGTAKGTLEKPLTMGQKVGNAALTGGKGMALGGGSEAIEEVVVELGADSPDLIQAGAGGFFGGMLMLPVGLAQQKTGEAIATYQQQAQLKEGYHKYARDYNTLNADVPGFEPIDAATAELASLIINPQDRAVGTQAIAAEVSALQENIALQESAAAAGQPIDAALPAMRERLQTLETTSVMLAEMDIAAIDSVQRYASLSTEEKQTALAYAKVNAGRADLLTPQERKSIQGQTPNGVPMFAGDAFTPEGAAYLAEQFPEIAQAAAIAPGMAYDAATPGTQAAPAAAPDPAAREAIVSRLAQIDQELAATPEQADAPRDLSPEGIQQRPSAALEQDEIEYKDILRQTITDPEAQENAKLAQQGLNAIRAERQRRAQDPAFIEPTPAAAQPNEQHAALNTEKASLLKQLEEIDSTPQPPPPDGGGQRPNIQRVEIDEPTQARANTISQQVLDRVRSTSPALADKISLVEQHPTYTSGGVQMNFDPEAPINIVPGDVAQLIAASPDATDAEIVQSLTEIIETHEVTHYAQFEQSKAEAKARGLTGTDSENFFTIYNERATQYQSESPEAWTVASELYGRNSENKSDEFSGWTTLSPAAQAAEVERMFVESLISKNGTPTDANRLLGASNGTLKTRLLELAQWIGDLITGNLRDAQGNVVPIPESIKARAQEIAATVEAIRAGTPLNVTPSTTNTSSPNTANSQQQSTPSQTGNGTGTPPQGNGNSQPANNGGTQPPPGNNAGASPPAKEGKLNQYGVFELSLEDGTYSRSPDGKWFWPDGTPVKSNLTGELEPSYQKFIATPAPTPKTPAASPPAAKVTPLNLGQAVSISFEDGTTGPGKVVVINADGSYTVTEDGRPGSMNKTASQLAPINSPQQQADPRVAASKTVRSEFDKALTARPLFKKDAALMQGLKEAAFDVSESLQGRPEAEVKEAAARAIGAYLQSPEVSEKLGQIYAAESAKAKAYRSAAAARVNAEADRVIGQRMSTVRDLIGSIGRITRPTNALELSRTGQTLPPEWNGMLRVSDYSGGGKNAVARAIIGKIYAQDTDTGISPDKAASGLEAELPEKYQGMTPDMLWQAIEKEIRGYLQGADTSSLEDPDMDTSGMTDDQIDTMVEKANKAATVEKWKGITGKAILDSTATAYETEYQKIVAEEGENSFLDDDYIERARATVDARLEAEAEAKRPKPKERSPTVEDDGSIFAAIDNGGQLQTDPTPSIKDRIKRWVSAMPGFQGGKAEMAGPVTQAVEEAMTPAQRDHFTTAVDYFGGGGSWAIFNALTSFKNIRNLIVYERNADRVEKIRLFHTKGNMVAEMLKNPTIVEALNNAASKARADGVPSGSAIARRININGISDPLVLGLKQAITDYLENSFGTKADEDGNITPEAKVAMAIRIVSQEAAAVYAAVTEFNKRGGTIEYRNNNSYEAMPEADSRTLAFVDPPYFLTKGYSYDEVADDLHDGQYKESITETTVGADTYGDTAALLKRLSDAGNGIIYTDSAWWKTIPKETDNSPSNAKRIKKAVGNVDGVPMMDMEIEQAEKNKASSYFGLTPDQRRLFHPEGRRILSDISSTLDRFDVVSGEIGAKRKEVLGIHYGNQPTTNTGRGARPQRLLDRPKNQGTPDGRVSTSERGGNPAQQTVPGMAGRITAEDGASRSESSDPLNDARLGSAAPQPSRSTSALQDVIAYNPGGRFGDGSPAAVEKALVAWAVNDQANKGPHVVRIVPVADITPSQTGEDYLNDSSRETARRISSGEVVDSRWQDAMPIIVDKDGNILNGNHRHASATINGDQTIPAVVPADSRLAQNPALFSPAAQAKEWTPKEIAALEEKVAHLKITGRPITPKNAFGDWAASPEDAGIIYGYRGESAPGAFTYPPTDNNNGSSEGVGLYIAKDSRDSEIFGKPRRVPFPEPKRPLIVDNDNGDPLPLLQEDEAAWERILSHKTEKGDSDWIKAHTLAAKQIGLTDETWQEKIDQFPRALTDVMLNMGYDAVYTRSAGMEWVTILAKPNQRFNRGTKSAGGTALYSPAPQAAPAAQYRYLKDKEAKAGLTPAEQQALLQSEKAMGQSFAIDMDDPALQARKGSVSPSFQPQLKLETQHPVTGKQLALFSPAPYSNAPDSLMGFSKNQGNQKSYQDQKGYRHEITVRLLDPDGKMPPALDGMRGLNRAHAMERARRNWKSFDVEFVADESLALFSSPAQQGAARHAVLEAKHNAGTITPTEREEAQRMVDAAAKAAGYAVTVFHGSPNRGITEFQYPTYTSRSTFMAEQYAGDFNYEGERTDGRVYPLVVKPGKTLKLWQHRDWVDVVEKLPASIGDQVKELLVKYSANIIDETSRDLKWIRPTWDDLKSRMMKARSYRLSGDAGYWNQDGYDLAATYRKGFDESSANFTNQSDLVDLLFSAGYDTLSQLEGGDKPSESATYIVKDSNRIKSAEPFTGVPLSERFNPQSPSILMSAPAQPVDDAAALDAALKGMDPIYLKVFQASQRATTPTPQELAAEFSLPERAIVNIIGTARTRIQAHGRTIRPGGLQPAKTADGKLKGGMPSRANSTTPALAAVDQIQQQEGLPLGTPDHEIIAAATKISSRPDAEQVIAASFSAGERSPAMVAATHQFLLEAGIKGLQSPTITEIALQYRAEGTAWADAGRARKDPHLTPAERNALIFQELFTSPNKGVQKAWREAKTPEQKQAILQEWNARVKGIKESLKARGLDLQEAMDRLAAQRNDAAAAEQEASQAHQKLVDRLQNDVTRLQAELAAAQDQAAKDVAQAKLDKATEQAAEAKALDPSNTIRLELEKLNRLERAAIEELRDGGTWQTAASVSFLSVADVKRVFDKFADALDDAGMRAILLAEDILLDQQARLGAPAANAMTREERAKQAAAGIRKALGYDSALIDRRSKGITPKPKKGKAQKQPAAAKPEPADMTDEQFQAYLDNPQTWRPAWQGEMAITGENTSFDQWINKPETRARKTRLTRMSKQPVSTTTGELDMHDPLSVKRAFDEFNIHNASLFDKAVSIWRMGILSGLHTGIINFTGNVAHSQYNLWPRRLMEAGVNNALSMLGLGSKEAATFGELKYMAQAQHKAMSRAGTAMVTSWNMDSRIVESEVLALGAQLEFSGIGADYIPKSVGGPLGKLLHSISFRHMTAADEMIKAYHAQTEVMAQAYRIAKNENLTGEAFDKRMDELLEYGSPAWKKAMDSATWVTFQNEVDPKNQRSLAIFDRVAYGLRHLSQTDTGRTKEITNAKGKKVTVAITKPNVFAFFFPFINTPLNIMKIGIEMSPIGAFFSIVDAARALKIRIKDKNISPERSRIAAAELYDRLRLVQDLTNQIIGMGMFYALGSLVKPGDEDDLPWITGSTDWKSTSKGDRDLRARVMPAYTVRVPFTDAMLTYQRIEPFGTALGFIVDARIAVNKKGFSDEALGEFMASAINQFNDKTFMKGLSDLMSLWNDPERIGTRLTSSIVTGFIPNLIRQPIREADPYLRDTKPGADIGFVEGVWHNIKYSLAPGYAPIAQDVWGNPLKRHPGMQVGNVHTDILLRVFDPTNLTVRDQIDPLDLYLFNWNNTAATPKERFNIEPIQKNLQIDRHGKTHTVTLTPEEHAQANRNAGKAAREMLGNDWDASNPQAQEVERVKEVLQKYQKRERDQLRDKYRSTLPQE